MEFLAAIILGEGSAAACRKRNAITPPRYFTGEGCVCEVCVLFWRRQLKRQQQQTKQKTNMPNEQADTSHVTLSPPLQTNGADKRFSCRLRFTPVLLCNLMGAGGAGRDPSCEINSGAAPAPERTRRRGRRSWLMSLFSSQETNQSILYNPLFILRRRYTSCLLLLLHQSTFIAKCEETSRHLLRKLRFSQELEEKKIKKGTSKTCALGFMLMRSSAPFASVAPNERWVGRLESVAKNDDVLSS